MITIRKELSITQGTAPYTYQWINNTTDCAVSFTTPSGTTNNSVETDVIFATEACILSASITIQVTDADGCTGTFPVTFTNPCATSPITTFSQDVVDNIVTITGVNAEQGLQHSWNFDNSIFTQMSINGNAITLQVNNPRPNVSSTIITLFTTDPSTGCAWEDQFVYNFCEPSSSDNAVTICQLADGSGEASICLSATPCLSSIDYTTINVTLPVGLSWTQTSEQCGTITVNSGFTAGNYVGTWNVTDLQGNVSNNANIFITVEDCNGTDSCISAPSYIKQLSCDDIAGLPGSFILVDLDGLVVTDGCEVDWSTFEFVAGAGQSASGTGVGASLTLTFGSIMMNANHELVYTFTSQPTGASEVVTWNVDSTSGDNTGNVQILISYDCTLAPVTVADSFDMTCEPPYPLHDILANDTGNINPSTVVITSQPASGNVIVNSDGTVQYVPGASTLGVITFDYTVLDWNNQVSNASTVTITVICAGEDTSIDQCGAITITPYDLLDGNKTTGGTWTQTSVGGPAAPGAYNGTMDFTAIADGIYTYEYEVTSGVATHTAVLTINHTADCCDVTTLDFSVTGETIAIPGANEARVQLSWDFGAGNLYTGTIQFENQTTGDIDNVVLVGASSTGSIFSSYDYSPSTVQDHPVIATFTLTDVATGCNCPAAVVNMFDIPAAVGVPVTFQFVGPCS